MHASIEPHSTLPPPLPQPVVLKFGINHITELVENRTAKLVRACCSATKLIIAATATPQRAAMLLSSCPARTHLSSRCLVSRDTPVR